MKSMSDNPTSDDLQTLSCIYRSCLTCSTFITNNIALFRSLLRIKCAILSQIAFTFIRAPRYITCPKLLRKPKNFLHTAKTYCTTAKYPRNHWPSCT